MQNDNVATGSFDPARGVQIPSTGLLGAAFAFLLLGAYAFFQSNILAGGGPPILDALAWLPDRILPGVRWARVNRDYYDILACVVLTFVFMVEWEFLRRRFDRIFVALVAVMAVATAWRLAWGGRLLPSPTVGFAGWDWTSFEVVLAVTLIFLLLPWLAHLRGIARRFAPASAGPALRTAFFRWLAGLAVFTGVLLVTYRTPFFLNPYYENWRITCGYLYSAYLLFGLPYAFVTALLRGRRFEDRSDPGFVLLLLFRRAGRALFSIRAPKPRWSLRNRRIGVVLRDLLVKVFFLPLMATFLYLEFGAVVQNLPRMWAAWIGHAGRYVTFSYFYGASYHSLFLVDVTLAMIGYASTSRWLDNKSKSVDPTAWGWFVCLACYPPFNALTRSVFPYDAAVGPGFPFLQPVAVDVALKLGTLICFAIYVWATTAFGLRFSNLTNRGIITRGPYAFVRHPAYAAKNVGWWLESIRGFASPWQLLFLLGWNAVYYARSTTEEKHLAMDPDYLAYCGRVRRRFIPGLW
jgi:protein-S-isoprenylcysteine O-methyltransferase Ste14